MPRSILVTGGAGYIGTHILTLLTDPHDTLVVLDDLSNGTRAALHAAETLANRRLTHFCQGDLAAPDALHLLTMLFQRYRFTSVIHLAGRKSVAACQRDPLGYYSTNVVGTLNLVRAMAENDCKTLIFSSSATVYAPMADNAPCYETSPVAASNCYGRTKVVCEDILRDVCAADPAWTVLSLRYFNPAGAHPSGTLGEAPAGGPPESLMPALCAVAAGRAPHLTIFGSDYGSPDGTPVRDFVHIMDLAAGHLAGLRWLDNAPRGFDVFNLGTGAGTSIRAMIAAMEEVTGAEIPCEVGARRTGDLGVVYADVRKAADVLEWRAALGVASMCRDAWRWDSAQSALGVGFAEGA